VHVRALSLTDFRSYRDVDISLSPGVSAFVGPNGQGKTNLVEAIEYAATQSSHRVATDAPLVRSGAAQAIVRTTVQRADREAVIELEINAGGANRARLNRGAFVRPRDALSILRTVVFSPSDLDMVKGDPGSRRRFLDTLLVARQPRFAAVRADYDRVVRQRNSLLKTAGRGRGAGAGGLETLEVWDAHLARAGAELLAGRLGLVDELRPHVATYYSSVAHATPKPAGGNVVAMAYEGSAPIPDASGHSGQPWSRDELGEILLTEMSARRSEELERGISLVGPHRDDLALLLGDMPARGYASHGESWSYALSLRLAAFGLLRADGDDPVLVLDDVFAELDDLRRQRLASVVSDAEQVLVTAAVPADVPADLSGHRFDVREGRVRSA
jgi:DNA replication and repair protein RecF